jgi:hypothetical protein
MKVHTLTAAGLAVAITLGGCQTTTNQGSDISGDQTRTVAEGAAAGAAAGALLGYLIGGDAGAAALGGLAGAGAGALLGNVVAERKAAYANEEEFLDGEIAKAREFNAAARSYNQKLSQRVADLDRTATTLMAQYRAGTANRATLETRRNAVRTDLAKAEDMQKTLEEEYKIQVAVLKDQREEQGADDPQVKALETEIAELRRNINALHDESVQLAEIDERMSL